MVKQLHAEIIQYCGFVILVSCLCSLQ